MSTAGSASTPQTQSTHSSPRDDWRPVSDPNERRRIQNRLAQRKYRDKVRIQREEVSRREYDERMAGASYAPPDPRQMEQMPEPGLPWGSFSLKYIVETGQARAQQAYYQRLQQQQESLGMPYQQYHAYRQDVAYSRNTSPCPPQPSSHPHQYYQHSQATAYQPGSSSLGLHLANDYARGLPLWQAWRSNRLADTTHHPSSVTTDSSMVSDNS